MLVILATPQADNSHGVSHVRIPEMLQGDDGLERHQDLLIVGWLLGSIIIAAFVSLLIFGARSKHPSPVRTVSFLVGGLIYEAVFAVMCRTYAELLHTGSSDFLGPFPAATTWLVFGIWSVPTYFVVLYVVAFPAWIHSPEEERQFQKLLAECDRKRGSYNDRQDVQDEFT